MSEEDDDQLLLVGAWIQMLRSAAGATRCHRLPHLLHLILVLPCSPQQPVAEGGDGRRSFTW
ncbi:hypothetical protein E2562_008468 [Oryza meyeriana var. granulata]|uniref:Uncharacterized protein n=1 Tax=Oryza meyeriana var. granulata TaxID=110450 RepID=A0A6G1EGG3_9ORYZ|nr:hypothetical protein E2562_008468 [Oryza meyeriana var. granulata]